MFQLKYSLARVFAFYALSALSTLNCFAKVHEYETSRLKSTAGAGVASITMDETTILNPAPLGFFNNAAFYLQKIHSTYTSESDTSEANGDSLGVIVSDAKNSLKGSLSYQKQKEWGDSRQRFAVSMASALSGQSSLGFTVKKTTDKSDAIYQKPQADYYQYNIGILHAISEYFAIGAVVLDPLKKQRQDTKALIGFQFTYQNIFSAMVDLGANYTQDLAESFLYKTALQMRLLNDLYLRIGMFRDVGQKEQGNGFGGAWVTPRLVVDFGVKYTKFTDDNYRVNPTTPRGVNKMSDLSFSLALQF